MHLLLPNEKAQQPRGLRGEVTVSASSCRLATWAATCAAGPSGSPPGPGTRSGVRISVRGHLTPTLGLKVEDSPRPDGCQGNRNPPAREDGRTQERSERKTPDWWRAGAPGPCRWTVSASSVNAAVRHALARARGKPPRLTPRRSPSQDSWKKISPRFTTAARRHNLLVTAAPLLTGPGGLRRLTSR
jgi:hypothetical protein